MAPKNSPRTLAKRTSLSAQAAAFAFVNRAAPALLIAFLVAVPSALLRAQQPPDSALIRALAPSDARVRIETAGVHIGRVSAVRSDSLTLLESTGPGQVAFRDIVSVSEEKSLTRHGAIVGGLAGGLIVGLLGAIVGDGMKNETSPPQSRAIPGFVGGFLLGAIPGSLVGAAIGAVSHEWRPIWPPR